METLLSIGTKVRAHINGHEITVVVAGYAEDSYRKLGYVLRTHNGQEYCRSTKSVEAV
jgi:hypothetical protein